MATGDVVTVACKLPSGLRLRIFKMVPIDEVVAGAARATTKAEEVPGVTFTVNGNSFPQNKAPRCLIVGGYALTPGCPKDLWDVWLEQNKDSDVVKNGLIFAHAKDQEASSRAESKEKASLRSGLERLDPEKLPNRLERVKPGATV